MIKGFLSSLISGILLITIGVVSTFIVGTNGDVTKLLFFRWGSSADMPVFLDDSELKQVTSYEETGISEDIALGGIEAADSITIDISGIVTYIRPTTSDDVRIYLNADECKADLKVETKDNELKIEASVKRSFFSIFGADDTAMLIELPQKIYDKVSLDVGAGQTYIYRLAANDFDCEVGAGKLYAADFAAENTNIDMGSGSLGIQYAEGYKGKTLNVDASSGKVTIGNAAVDSYYVELSSGNVDICGVTGTGKVDISSGNAEIQFAEQSTGIREFNVGSGNLKVFVPDDTKALLTAKVGSGKVSVECCDTSETIKRNSETELNDGGRADGEYRIDIGSGNCKVRDNDDYDVPDIEKHIPGAFVEGVH